MLIHNDGLMIFQSELSKWASTTEYNVFALFWFYIKILFVFKGFDADLHTWNKCLLQKFKVLAVNMIDKISLEGSTFLVKNINDFHWRAKIVSFTSWSFLKWSFGNPY